MASTDIADHSPPLPRLAAAEVQDDLPVASNDPERLQCPLSDDGEALVGHFYAASDQLKKALQTRATHPETDAPEPHRTMEHGAGAIERFQADPPRARTEPLPGEPPCIPSSPWTTAPRCT